MSNKRILIIDPQKDFIDSNGAYGKKHTGITRILDAKEKINRLLSTQKKEELIIITSDYQKDQFEKGLSICISGTEGHMVGIDADESYTYFSKTRHSCFSSGPFTEYLKIHGIKELVICGFLAEYCVKQTAIDALDVGYDVLLIKDCIGTGDDVQERKEEMLAALKERGARITESLPAISKRLGREAFGADPAGYHTARPAYPDWVFEVLSDRCGLRPDTATFEVGAGTGIATRRLLDLGASPLIAVEPDERLAKFLEETIPDKALKVITSPFEDAILDEGYFDLGVSATAFHWLHEEQGLTKAAGLLRPGGWWVMVWNVFGDTGRADPFHDATKVLLDGPSAPSEGKDGRPHFALDAEARIAALQRTGAFDTILHRSEPWTLTLDPDQTVALYATYSNISIRPDKDAVLAELGRIARRDFSDGVTRNIVTSLYIARRIFTPA